MQQQRVSRRSFLQLTAGSVAVATLAACAGPIGAPAATEGEAAASAEGITLSFLNRGGQFIEDVMGQQMDLYREAHPEINFEINAVAGSSHQEMLLTMIASSAPHNLAKSWPTARWREPRYHTCAVKCLREVLQHD